MTRMWFMVNAKGKVMKADLLWDSCHFDKEDRDVQGTGFPTQKALMLAHGYESAKDVPKEYTMRWIPVE